MNIKKSANVGKVIERLIEGEGISLNQLSLDLGVSPQMGSHIKNERRPLQKDIAKRAINVFNDCPAFVMDLIFEFSSGFSAPVLRGKAIEQHRLSFKHFLLKEWTDVYGRIRSEDFDWCKPPEEASKAEKDWVKDLIVELNEMEMAAANFRCHLYEAYLINPKQVRDETLTRIKAKGWVEA
ncbi:helix-turn-helix domain-containing protein [Domibacillus epiphyticus]|uniref:Uncharacterized protein n=1 Tax=Domibacillus epiphyticus TaxID=1714355 RepID=A0A1V2A7W2_9BACI|nr:hypothetical protein [Domibacillus epiphyticus]OMP67056.1 hypothetical protein BTO28_08720 [Domibacillus epiphyticus]